MQFEIDYDHDGKPVYVRMFDGVAHIGRPFEPKTDGWMLDQLDPREFPIIRAGRQMESLLNEVNALRRENWKLKQTNKEWQSARL